jgi:hypothetical protein
MDKIQFELVNQSTIQMKNFLQEPYFVQDLCPYSIIIIVISVFIIQLIPFHVIII